MSFLSSSTDYKSEDRPEKRAENEVRKLEDLERGDIVLAGAEGEAGYLELLVLKAPYRKGNEYYFDALLFVDRCPTSRVETELCASHGLVAYADGKWSRWRYLTQSRKITEAEVQAVEARYVTS